MSQKSSPSEQFSSSPVIFPKVRLAFWNAEGFNGGAELCG